MPALTAPYFPDDSRLVLPALEFLRSDSGETLRHAVQAIYAAALPSVADVTRLRKEFPSEAVHAALALGALQLKARQKFPDIPYLWSPPEALEQASGSHVARHKAARFAAVLAARGSNVEQAVPQPLYDLCAGMGGDSLALADIAAVTAIDLSPIRLACLAFNAADRRPPPKFPINTLTADIGKIIPTLPPKALVHIDPARRAAGKRSPLYADLIPGPDTLETLLARVAGVALKLSPAVDFDSLPKGHLELISEEGSVVQAVLWTGELAFAPTAHRTATLLFKDRAAFSYTAAPARCEIADIPIPLATLLPQVNRPQLLELDGALTRAGLAAAFTKHWDLLSLTPDGGYALARSANPDIPAATPFEILGIFPYSQRRIEQLLPSLPANHGHPAIEVKCRGHLPGIDTDHLQITWNKISPGRYSVLIFSHHKEFFAAVGTRRHPLNG